jgi:hypothetical protein
VLALQTAQSGCGRSMRGAKFIQNFMTSKPNEVDDALLNTLKTALEIIPVANRTGEWQRVNGFYEGQIKKLEAKKPGMKRWGLEWQSASEVEEKLKQAQTTMKNLAKEPDKDLMKALEDYIKEVDAPQDKLAARDEGLGFAGKDQVADDIGNLFVALGGNFGPTRGQREYFAEIQPAYRTRMGDMNKFLRETLLQWNEKLRGWNAPTLTTRKPFEF